MAKQFMQLFAGTFFISLFVLMMQFLWRYLDDLIGKGLSLEVLAQFFWYMGLMLVPQALPLAVLLASLITMGNIGENSELTAIKAAGISLVQALRSLFFISVMVAFASFYFQNNIAPAANLNMAQLLRSMQQKSPELEIPEGIFYNGIQDYNLYVQKKNLESGMLYGVMIYRITGGYEKSAIILADSGMLQTTADRNHLLLTLHSGEWFEDMQASEISDGAAVPYRRETFITKRIVLDFDNGFNLADAGGFSSNAKVKSLSMISYGLDSLKQTFDSLGMSVRSSLDRMYYDLPSLSKKDSLLARKKVAAETFNIDTVISHYTDVQRREALQRAISQVQMVNNELEFRKDWCASEAKTIREHWIEAVNKFTLAITCLIFFFIGAPLGAIIRKGGLGVPVIISVVIFIVFYILDNTGYRMARLGAWPVWLGKGLAPAVLTPLATFVTWKANKDSAVFNMDVYRNVMLRLLGLRLKRRVAMKEVVIDEPKYAEDVTDLREITSEIEHYAHAHHLAHAPNIIKVFFAYEPDSEIKRINDKLEEIIWDMSNARDRFIIEYLNKYPVVSEKAHTRPFERKWLNVTAFFIFPVGIFLYFRMWRFRLRLLHDLRQIRTVNGLIEKRVDEMREAKS